LAPARNRRPSGFLPADGRRHALIIPLPGPGQASYPLRLLGLRLCLTLPPFDPAHPLASPALRLRVLALATARADTGPFGRPFSLGTGLASWRATGVSQSVPVQTGGFAAEGPLNGMPPAVRGWHGGGGGSQQLDFLAGHGPSPLVAAEASTPFSTAPTGQIMIMPRPPVPPIPASALQITSGLTPRTGPFRNITINPGVRFPAIPAIATGSYLSRNHLRIGSIIPAPLNTALVPVRIVASVTGFPATPPASRVLIADLAEVQDFLAAQQADPLPVTRWWLRTGHGQVPRRLPPGLSAADLASQQAALLHDPLLAAPRQAMLAIGGAAVLLAALGFAVSVAASVRERRTHSAVLAALGVGRPAQAGQLCLEQLLLSLPAAAVGLLAGTGLAWLLVPSITLTANATAPLPPALVMLPLGQAAGLALIIAAVPAIAAAVSILRRPDPAAQLRAEAG
jgi:hypothetical protein